MLITFRSLLGGGRGLARSGRDVNEGAGSAHPRRRRDPLLSGGPGREAAANGAGNGKGNRNGNGNGAGNRNGNGAAVRSRPAPDEEGPAAPSLQVSGCGAAVACAGRGGPFQRFPSSGAPGPDVPPQL